MLRLTSLFVALLAYSICATSHAQENTNTLRFKPSAIIDASGFGQPQAALTLFIPKGWKTAGGIEWSNEYLCTNGYAVRWQALAPDALSGALILPQLGWEFSSNRGPVVNINCNKAPIYTVESYLRTLMEEVLPQARDIVFNLRSDLLSEFPQTESETAWAMGVQQAWIEAGELSFKFTEKNTEMEGHLAAIITFEKTITQSENYYAESVRAQALPAYGTFAPLGQYNAALFRAMRKSLKPDSTWAQQIARHNASMENITLNGIAERGKIVADANLDINAIISQTWQSINSDNRAQEFIAAIRETQTYQDTHSASGETELSGHYNYAWRLEDGSYVLTDETDFNPEQTYGLSGTQLHPVR